MRDETVHSPVYCVGGAPVSYHRRRSGLRTQTGRYQLSPSTAEMTESFSVSASPARFNCHAQPLACTSPAVGHEVATSREERAIGGWDPSEVGEGVLGASIGIVVSGHRIPGFQAPCGGRSHSCTTADISIRS